MAGARGVQCEHLQTAGLLRERVLAALQEVIDPDVGISVVELGLVYGADVAEGGDVRVALTIRIAVRDHARLAVHAQNPANTGAFKAKLREVPRGATVNCAPTNGLMVE